MFQWLSNVRASIFVILLIFSFTFTTRMLKFQPLFLLSNRKKETLGSASQLHVSLLIKEASFPEFPPAGLCLHLGPLKPVVAAVASHGQGQSRAARVTAQQ